MPRSTSSLSKQGVRGFSLVEVVASVLLMGTLLTAVLVAHRRAADQLRCAQRRLDAVEVLEMFLELRAAEQHGELSLARGQVPGRDDLQYACIYPRPNPAPCTTTTCDCDSPGNNPVCQSDDGTYSTTAKFARALPRSRPLRLLQALGDRAAVGSVCAAPSTSPSQPSFGYKPAFDAALRMLRTRIE